MLEIICEIDETQYKLDVDDDIALTYQQTDFSSPEAVKNGYTKTIELKPTKNNIDFFECGYRFDRVNKRFDPTKKIDAVILVNGGLVDRGYIVLDTVTIEDNMPTFNITFYSALGQFLYNLTTNDNGDDVYLSDLYYGFPTTDYKYMLTKEQETDDSTIFTLNSKYVYDSWKSLAENAQYWTTNKKSLSLKDKMLSNIVPVPCYSGYSENIDTENALIWQPSAATTKKYDVNTSTLMMGGYSKAELAREMDEWEIRDIRASEQHLGVRWSFILDAIFNSENNGGYTVNFPYKNDNQSFVGRYYNNGFVIMPRINNEEDNINLNDVDELSHSTMTFKQNGLGSVKITPTVNTSNWTNVVLQLDVYTTWKIRSYTKGINNCYTCFNLWTHKGTAQIDPKDLKVCNFLGIWVSYRGVDGRYKKKWFSLLNSPLIEHTKTDGDSTVTTSFHLSSQTVPNFRKLIKDNYWYAAKNENTFWGKVYRCLENPIEFSTALVAGTKQDEEVSSTPQTLYQSYFQNETPITLIIDDMHKTEPDITVLYDYFKVGYIEKYDGKYSTFTKQWIVKPYDAKIFDLSGDVSADLDIMYKGYLDAAYGLTSKGYVTEGYYGQLYEGKWCYLNDDTSEYYSALYNTTSTQMPVNNITKKLLFGTDYTACDYLLQFVKMCNLRLRYDKLNNRIDILTLKDYYKDEVIDLTKMIDRSQNIEINYNYYDFNKLLFGLTNSDGDEAESYPEYLYHKKTKGSMNNYTFDTKNNTQYDSTTYLDNSILNSCVDYNMKSQWFSADETSFLLKGSKCTLITYNSDDLTELNTQEYLKQWNLQTKYLDIVPKLALFDKDNGALDGYYTAFFGGFANLYDPIQISDNLPVMKQLNDDCCYIYWLDRVIMGEIEYKEGAVTGVVKLNPTQNGVLGYQTKQIPLFTMNDYYVDSDEIGEAAVWEEVIEANKKQSTLEALDNSYLTPIRGLWWDKPTLLYSNSVLSQETIYSSCFANYISDIYDNNTFTVTMYCRLPLMGNLDEMFRTFFWYDNALFVLNKVSDYNPTNNGFTQCEFIKVQDKYHYL